MGRKTWETERRGKSDCFLFRFDFLQGTDGGIGSLRGGVFLAVRQRNKTLAQGKQGPRRITSVALSVPVDYFHHVISKKGDA